MTTMRRCVVCEFSYSKSQMWRDPVNLLYFCKRCLGSPKNAYSQKELIQKSKKEVQKK